MKPQRLHREIGAATDGRSQSDQRVLCTHEHRLQNVVHAVGDRQQDDVLHTINYDTKRAMHVAAERDPTRAHKQLAWHRDHLAARLQHAEIKTKINT